jgi:hypothetical protein
MSGPASDGLSMTQALRTMAGWATFARQQWKLLLLAAILGGALGIAFSLIQHPKYEASLTFVVEDPKSGGLLGSYTGLASQFGIDLGGGSGSGVFNGDNVLEFLQSRLMVQQTLLTDTVWNGKRTTLGDIFLNVYHWKDAWKKNPALADFNFPLNTPWFSLNRLQDSIMAELYGIISKGVLDVTKPDKKLDFVEVKTRSRDEVFSKLFTERLVVTATNFYVETKTQRSRNIVDKLQAQADSILDQLNKTTVRAAVVRDVNLNPSRELAQIGSSFATRDEAILMTMYAEVAKNLEISKTTLGQDTPIIQVVDSPIFPLKKVKLGKLLGLIIGGFLAAFIVFLLLYFRKLYREIM